jgi:hypothetical protein
VMRKKLPAEYPDGPWPAEMRAPTAAAFFDFQDTAALFKAVAKNEAPRPTATRGAKREPIWARLVCEEWIAQRHNVTDTGLAPGEDIASLLTQ